ncbi:hypothetical protein [Myxacorys almedinensis]|uniref:Uncharacterized protein n=1 Tax=Myxacorys almedinensis A TaxID=2690445 RepID=A0A8J7Z7I9_9CYAN|nr:hypothetical protein [Myxacorys almedinensis]NDJ16950.1 hypothetical protein [Myxacorys almedinensis A]
MGTLFLLVAIAFYVSLMPLFFRKWMMLSQEQDIPEEARSLSTIVVAIATLFWLFVLPFAYLDLLEESAQP